MHGGSNGPPKYVFDGSITGNGKSSMITKVAFSK
jgi:hypothetical protein